jgi:hypothetical protein
MMLLSSRISREKVQKQLRLPQNLSRKLRLKRKDLAQHQWRDPHLLQSQPLKEMEEFSLPL